MEKLKESRGKDKRGNYKHFREEREYMGDDEDAEKCIKRLRVNSDDRVDIPRKRPHNRRLPIFDNMDAICDVDYSQVNSVLKELAEMREFRSRMKLSSRDKARTKELEEDEEDNDDMKQG